MILPKSGPRYLWWPFLRTIAAIFGDMTSILGYETAAVRGVDPETLADVVSVRPPTPGQRWHRVR
jgi:hypothetical protein